MKNGFFSEHWNDTEGRPGGGVSSGRGFVVSWQNGPLGREADRREPNGAFVEDVIAVVIDRLKVYQASEFACEANQRAIEALETAANVLDDRTKDRENRGVEGTHQL